MNLASVVTTGNLTATSEGGSIVDSGNGSISIPGSTTLKANNDIVLGLSGSQYPTLALTAGGNVSVKDTVAVTLGASTVGGTFALTDTAASANAVKQNGALVITGDTTILATDGSSGINLSSTGNQFGALRFQVGTNGATINEATTLNLKAGTVASGPVFLSTGGNFITSGSGASSFLSTNAVSPNAGLSISAPTGTIIPGSGSLVVINGLTVYSNNAIDLSGLSLGGNLNSIQPTHLGTGTYSGPSTP